MITIAEALRRPRYLISMWPWRALAYLATTVPFAGALGAGLFTVLGPSYAAVHSSVQFDVPFPEHMLVLVIGATVIIVGLAPVVGDRVATVERWRLALVDPRPVLAPRFARPAARYSTAAGWRQAGYAFWLGGVVPVSYMVLGLLVAVDLSMIAGVWVTRSADDVVMLWSTVDTPAQALPYSVAGALLLPVLAYVLGLVAAAQATVARWLLGPGGDGTARTEVTRS